MDWESYHGVTVQLDPLLRNNIWCWRKIELFDGGLLKNNESIMTVESML